MVSPGQSDVPHASQDAETLPARHHDAGATRRRAHGPALSEGTGRGRRALRWCVVAASFFVLVGLWAVATPAMSSPDEPSHTVKAVAVARGELLGSVGPRPTTWMVPGALTTVKIPADYASVADLNCYATVPDQDASCMPALPSDSETLVDATTAAGHYPPLYYALVGWPSRFLPADPGILVMRLVSGALSTAFVVAGLVALRATRAPRALRWGAVSALTPMCLFLFGTINPNGLEISTAFAAWASAGAVFRSRGRPPVWLLSVAGVSFAVLANIRSLSPLWAVVVLVITIATSWSAQRLWQDRRRLVLGSAVGVVVVSVPSLLWAVRHGTLLTGEGLWPQYQSVERAVTDMVLTLTKQYEQMIGNFGWFDSPAPLLTLLLWTVSVGMLFALAMQATGQRLAKAALVVLLVGVVVGPMIIQLPGAADAGLVWQGRYTLPIAIGIPLLAGWLLSSSDGVGGASGVPQVRQGLSPAEGVARGMLVALGIAHAVAFYGAARRYAVGSDGPYVTSDPAWSSNLGFVPAVLLYAVALAVFLVALSARGRGEVSRDGRLQPDDGGLTSDQTGAPTSAHEVAR